MNTNNGAYEHDKIGGTAPMVAPTDAAPNRSPCITTGGLMPKSTPPILSCERCGVTFVARCATRTYRPRYCSQQCANAPVPHPDRFWAKVDTNGPIPAHLPDLGRCWDWIGSLSPKGYGQYKLDGRTRQAHVVAYEIVVGVVPIGKQLDHLCRNRRCVRPDHTEPVTSRENTLRGKTIPARFAAATTCKRGHPLTTDNVVPSATYRKCLICNRERERARQQAVRDRKKREAGHAA
jgi:hypothetical protein